MNKPFDVAKLLDQLSGSTAWKEALDSQNKGQHNPNVTANESRNANTRTHARSKVEENVLSSVVDSYEPYEPSNGGNSAVAPSDKVQELLKLLGTDEPDPHSADNAEDITMRDDVSPEGVSRTQTPSNAQPGADSGEYSSKGKERSLKDMPFIDALEEVSRLAKKSHVIKHLAEIRDEQRRLEKRYWDQREQILLIQKGIIKGLKTKVAITGPLGPREVERLTHQFNKELSDLEQNEFLPAWDNLLSRQQATLERMGVPCMYVTNDAQDRQKQQQVLAILEEIVEKSDSRR